MRISRFVFALILLAGVVSLTLPLAAQQEQPAAVPTPPSGLTYWVNGSSVTLFWNAESANHTQYIIEAGGTPGTTFFTFPTAQVANPSTLQERLPFFNAVAPAGNYYVRVRAANAEGASAPSNEVLVPVTGGCQAPGAPTDLGAIVRGSFGRLQWNPSSGGLPTSYVLRARTSPSGPIIAAFQVRTPFMNVGGIPTGTYFVDVVAQTACGSSAGSNMITVTAPSNSAARTPNAPGGRVPIPYVEDIVLATFQERPDLVAQSCPNPTAKYTLNPFVNFLVDRLRTWDQRFGYNSKPTRGPADNGGLPVVVAGDEIAYHYGSDAPEGSPNTIAIDIMFSHCGTSPGFVYRRLDEPPGEYVRWTGAGRF